MTLSSNKFIPKKSHFFQLLLPDFLTNFSIPKAFLKQYLHVGGRGELKSNNELVVLRDRKSAKTWYIEVDLPRYNFKEGWKKFCADHNLQIGDFLVFRNQQNLVFDVYIFDPSACEREFPGFNEVFKAIPMPLASKPPRNYQGLEMMEDKEDGVSFKSSGRPYFRTEVKKSSLICGTIWLPKGFALQIGLEKNNGDMVLLDEEGQSWSMGLRYNKACDGHHLYKWPSLYKVMGLHIGQPVIFELINSNGYFLMKFYRFVEDEDC